MARPAGYLTVDPLGDWAELAACAGRGLRDFFPQGDDDLPPSHGGRRPRRSGEDGWVTRAKAICAQCSVRLDCLDHALAFNEDGVWGGTTYDERKLIRRNRRKLHA